MFSAVVHVQVSNSTGVAAHAGGGPVLLHDVLRPSA
jgi:hypothetical protein